MTTTHHQETDKEVKRTARKGNLSAKRIAFCAVFVALVLGAQYALSAIPYVEVVTLLFVSFSFAFGAVEGMFCATAFSFLRCFIFGFYPTVIVEYLVYFNFLAGVFGMLGKRFQGKTVKKLVVVSLLTVVFSVWFTLLDDLIVPVYYGLKGQAVYDYFYASLPFMFWQTLCAFLTVLFGFLPIEKVFSYFAKKD